MTPSAQTAGGRRVRRWTRELIIEKILEWEARYGEPPCSADWNPSLARWRAQEWREQRYRDGVWPSTNAAKRPFDGSFAAAVRAAGLEPHRPGPKRKCNVAEGESDVGAVRLAGETKYTEAQRHERPARRAAETELTAALARAAALESALLVVEDRAERAEDEPGDARTPAQDRVEELIADAEARVRAAGDQALAAVRDAADARRETAAAERRACELSALVGDGQRRLTGGELTALREGGPSGPAVLARGLRRLARARAAGDRGGLAAALAEVASAAVRWRDRL